MCRRWSFDAYRRVWVATSRTSRSTAGIRCFARRRGWSLWNVIIDGLSSTLFGLKANLKIAGHAMQTNEGKWWIWSHAVKLSRRQSCGHFLLSKGTLTSTANAPTQRHQSIPHSLCIRTDFRRTGGDSASAQGLCTFIKAKHQNLYLSLSSLFNCYCRRQHQGAPKRHAASGMGTHNSQAWLRSLAYLQTTQMLQAASPQ